MDLFAERCAGIDIGKADLKACIRTPGPRGGRRSETRTFATTTAGVLALQGWLTDRQVRLVGMESTGVYWKPIFYPLEDHFECWQIGRASCRERSENEGGTAGIKKSQE